MLYMIISINILSAFIFFCHTFVCTWFYADVSKRQWEILFNILGWSGDGGGLWTDATKSTDGTWLWSDGTVLDPALWNPPNPNGNGPCTSMYRSEFRLDDLPCGGGSATREYICEKFLWHSTRSWAPNAIWTSETYANMKTGYNGNFSINVIQQTYTVETSCTHSGKQEVSLY